MNVEDAIPRLQEALNQRGGRRLKLCIPVFRPGSIGGTPCVDVEDIEVGFDHNSGKVMLHAEKRLTLLSSEDVEAIHTSVRAGQSWHAYQAHLAMDKKLKEANARAEALQKELDELRSISSQ